MKRGIAHAVLIVLIASFHFPPVASASTLINGCSSLSSPGETYLLTQDILDSPVSVCMNIVADNVILDCQGHTIDGTGRSSSTGVLKN